MKRKVGMHQREVAFESTIGDRIGRSLAVPLPRPSYRLKEFGAICNSDALGAKPHGVK